MSAYYRTGRGGAGNFKSAEEIKKEQDIEAQEHEDTVNILAAEAQKAPNPGEYKHMGRGGAGNWFTPSTTPSAPAAPAPEEGPEPITTTAAASQSSVPMRVWSGRGGAGNYVPPSEGKAVEIEMEQKERAQRLHDEVRQSVDMVLERPGRVYVPGVERRE